MCEMPHEVDSMIRSYLFLQTCGYPNCKYKYNLNLATKTRHKNGLLRLYLENKPVWKQAKIVAQKFKEAVKKKKDAKHS